MLQIPQTALLTNRPDYLRPPSIEQRAVQRMLGERRMPFLKIITMLWRKEAQVQAMMLA